ncbi:MAG TPA: GTP-binding protein [Burkholderiales bacterium]
MIPDGRTPVFVVTGFLGSGKTTLVNELVKRMGETLVIVNEFGEVPVDHHLMQAAEEKAVALPNGCLCCHLRGDLEETLIGAAMRRRRGEIAGFDRVVVETSGLADPGPVAQTLYADRALERDFKLGPIVTVVDAADTGKGNLGLDIAKSQIAAADVIVLSKVDLATGLAALKEEVEALNPHARQVPARFGDVDPALLEKSGTDRVFSTVAHHDHGINTFHLEFDRPPRKDLLERFLALLVELRGADLLRVKGIVALEGGEHVTVQGVRHVFDRLRPIENRPPTGLVFITRNMAERDVQALWQAMSSLKAMNRSGAGLE